MSDPRIYGLHLAIVVLLSLVAAAAGCGDDEGEAPYEGPVTLALVDQAPVEAEAGAALATPLIVETRDTDGRARSGVSATLAVTRGGGSVANAEVVSDKDGQIVLDWTLGVAPVRNTLNVASGDASLDIDIDGVRADPLQPEPFGDIDGHLGDTEGSTEDLAFDGSDPQDVRLIIGVPGGLVELDSEGNATDLELSGDPIVGPLGVALDDDGSIWVADAEGEALRHVDGDGVVTTIRTDNGRPGDDNRALAGPNYIAFDEAGRLYLSDPCLGEVIRIDPDAGEADAWLDFDLPTQGGPNGLAFDVDGRLAIATENTGLLCEHNFVGLIDEIAGLYYVTVDDDGFGELETVIESGGLFGDGLAYDVEGNLYVIFDTQLDLQLEESAVWVLPAGGDELRPLLSVDDAIFANLAFGRGEFGETTLYIAMLAIVPFVGPETRGLMRFDLGVGGLL